MAGHRGHSSRRRGIGTRRRKIAIAAGAVAVTALALLVAVVPDNRVGSPPDTSSLGSGAPLGADPRFVSTAGTQLFLDGRPYRFLGFNSYVMLGCGNPEERLGAPERAEFFAGLRPRSVVRLWVFPGIDLREFDQVIQDASRHGHKLVATLTDGRGGCGDTEKGPDWYAGGFRGEYLTWIRAVVPRYRDEPAIGMWELINEPGEAEPETLRAFMDEAGALVRSLDDKHLIGSGTLQPASYGGVAGYLHISASPAIDVLSLHEYDQVPEASGHLGPALETARALGKPLMVGEFGLYASASGADGPEQECLTYDERQRVATAKLRDYLDEPEVAGVLYWSYTRARPLECALNLTKDDPLVHVVRTLPLG